MIETDVLVIGGGPAGLAAAIAASNEGAKVVILERAERLGGILVQCIHNGFGLHKFNEELTGPEYAERYKNMLAECKHVKVFCNAYCYDVAKKDGYFLATATTADGLLEICAKAVIMTLGCRERPAASIELKGTRPAGIFTAGTVQKLINLEGKMVGRNVVILGSGDIGLIMARRLTCEGANVLGLYEIMPACGGLARNVTQCLNDFNIPLHLSTTITKVVGKQRLEGVFVAPVDEKLNPISELEKFVPCDTLLLSVGLLPEVEIAMNLNLEWLDATNSFAVDEFYQTSVPGLFCAGNVLHVNDLVDNVSSEGERAGLAAAKYCNDTLNCNNKITVEFDEHIKYTSPKYVYRNKEGSCAISFRVKKTHRQVVISAFSGNLEISHKPAPIVNAGEMQVVYIDKTKLGNSLKLEIDVLEE